MLLPFLRFQTLLTLCFPSKKLEVEQHARPHSTELKNRIHKTQILKPTEKEETYSFVLTVTWGLLFIRYMMMAVIVKLFV